MLELIPKVSLEKIYSLLPAKEKSQSKISDLIELEITKNEQFIRKRFFKLKSNQHKNIHLTYGKNLKEIYNKSKIIHKLIPNLTCKPLFLNSDGEKQLFGQEFFNGIPIDKALDLGKIYESEVAVIIDTLKTEFLSLEKNSTISAWNNEFRNFQDQVLNNSNFLDLDWKCLKSYLFPILKKGLSIKKPTIRWTPGDLSARNILVSNDKDFRFIDYEYANETHFHDEDWLRLSHFSLSQFQESKFLKLLLRSVNPYTHIYFLLRQTVLDKNIHPSEIYKYYTSEYLLDCLVCLDNNDFENSNLVPLFFRGISKRINNSKLKIEKNKYDLQIKDTEIKTIKKLYEERNKEVTDLQSEILIEKESSKIKGSTINSLQKDINAEKEISKMKDITIDSLQKDINAEKDISKQKDLTVSSLELNLHSINQKVIELGSQLEEQRNYRLIQEMDLEVKNDKISRMQNSFSWKITSPLRYFRRIKDRLCISKISVQQIVKSSFLKPIKKQNLPATHVISPFEFEDNFSKYSKINSEDFKFTQGALKFCWIIPDFGIGSGGHTTIFRMIMWLETFGHKSTIMICGGTHHGNANQAKEIILSYFFPLNASVEILVDPKFLKDKSDIIISTSYDTCYYSRNIDSSAPRFYFVQDYEPQFASLGSYYYLAKNTYSFGFNCVTAGKWLAKKISSVGGNVSGYFELAVDKNIFFPKDNFVPNDDTIATIAVYSRSATARRMTELAIFGLNLLSQRGYQFKVVFFGDSKIPIQACFEHKILGVVDPTSLAELYRSANIGCVFSGTNYSLVPLEMMASGLPIVEFDGPNTRNTFPEGSVRFAKPNPISIADEIQYLLTNEENKKPQIKKALDFTKNLSWEKSARKFEKIVNKELVNRSSNHEG
jgi:glycosyltransferase involved in cell wall biosynthesis